jgi:hypothetical protein
MTKNLHWIKRTIVSLLVLVASVAFGGDAKAQCPGSTVTGGLQLPSKIVQTEKNNLIVAETLRGAKQWANLDSRRPGKSPHSA